MNPMPLTVLLLSLTLLACKAKERDADDRQETGVENPIDFNLGGYDGRYPDPRCAGFSATAMEWSLPSINGNFKKLPGLHTTDVSSERHYKGEWLTYVATTFDITGDRVADLVVTVDEADPNIGQSYWWVHEGGPDGFSAIGVPWSLPPIEGDFASGVAYATTGAADDRLIGGLGYAYNYTTFDLTADGVSDIIFTYDTYDADFSGAQWLVYAGGVGGFSELALKWSIPTLEGDSQEVGSFYYTEGEDARKVTGNKSYWYQYETFDITGDGVNDLVLTWDEFDLDSGTSYWLVYTGGADGFSSTPMKWTLPLVEQNFREGPAFSLSSKEWSYRVGDELHYGSHTTVDLTGDGISELIVTWDEGNPEIGNKHWLVYKGGLEGFSTTVTEWTLPSIPGYFPDLAPLRDLASSGHRSLSYDDEGNYIVSTFDITGDGAKDLVVTADWFDQNIGSEYWLVFRGGESGFLTPPIEWALPSTVIRPLYVHPPLYDTKIEEMQYDDEYFIGYYFVSTFDITGDGLPDLVITYDGDENTGKDFWLVYEGLCE
jgi:hypothetical protein